MLSIIKRDLLILIRDRGNMFFVVIFPSLLVFLLGNLLGNMDKADNVIEPITINYCIETKSDFGLIAVDNFIQALEGHKSVKMVENKDIAQNKSLVDEGKVSAAILFKEPLAIDLYEGHNKIQNRAVNSMLMGFSRQTTSMKVLAESAPEKLGEALALPNQDYVQKKEFGYKRTMLDYYAVTMLVMILFMSGAIAGASSLYESRKDGTLSRMVVSPKNRFSLYIQTVLGCIPMVIMQIVCVMLSSVLMFKAHYADTMQDNVLLFTMFFFVGFCLCAIFMVVGLFINANPTLVVMPIVWVMLFISGTFSKEVTVKGITQYVPSWIIQNAAFDLTIFGRGDKAVLIIIISICITAAASLIGAALFNRKGVVLK